MIFGLVKFGNRSTLGGEVVRAKRRRNKLIQIILFLVAFALLNAVLYYLTRI